MSRRHLMLALIGCAAVLALPARAQQEREFPANAKRGRMAPGYFPELTLDGKVRRLSPSGRIFNQENLVEPMASLRGSYVVNYTEDANGDIDRIWILTPEEARRKPR
ncbi:hypothetical protein [Massilia endophytica]|uniref:hypothetical protein n=1 Tax=Massilia endophytica TaxID=2899220 RepID=UPI001E65D321|nr:hypothetical protein [Massilia endophytica]UGQ45499.1 hypothetical protein LSQ66_17140 [Massilia endophytica]